jgi:hypothetical protein
VTGLEPVASTLARWHSTIELHPHESDQRDSNPQHSAWKADALPLGYGRIKDTRVVEQLILPPRQSPIVGGMRESNPHVTCMHYGMGVPWSH